MQLEGFNVQFNCCKLELQTDRCPQLSVFSSLFTVEKNVLAMLVLLFQYEKHLPVVLSRCVLRSQHIPRFV